MNQPVSVFSTPLYTAAEAAHLLDLPPSTFQNWTKSYTDAHKVTHPALVTKVPTMHGSPSLPFIGLTEGFALAAFRRSGVPMQRIRPALQRISEEIGLEHALGSKSLYSDGAEILYDYAQTGDEGAEDLMGLVVVRSGQRVLTEVVRDYLQQIEWRADGYANLIHLPRYKEIGVDVVVDPERGFGQPIVVKNAVRVADILSRVRAGDETSAVAADYGLEVSELGDLISAERAAA